MSNSSIFNKVSVISVALLLTVFGNNQQSAGMEAEKDNLLNNPESTNQHIISSKTSPPPLAIFFGIGENDIPESSNQQIKDIAQYLIETGDSFEIEGCASTDGSDGSNFALATGRAHKVLNALESEGVPITRYMDIEGIIGQDRDIYGAEEGECTPLIEGLADTDEQSRRANINLNPVYKQDPPEPREPSEFEKDLTEFGENISEALQSIDDFFSFLNHD